MRKLMLFIGVALMVSCAPGKRDEPVHFDIYCDSCYVKIENMWFEAPGSGKPRVYEYPFDGVVQSYKRVTFHRFDSPNNCIRPIEFMNYGSDTCWIYIIENGDTTASLDNGGAGYCN
jgi:hypothetical protein